MAGPKTYLRETCGASDETIAKLDLYAALLEKWNAKINLVSPTTLDDVWGRHIQDSAQLYPIIKPLWDQSKIVADLGSGAGFPGLVLALLGIGNIHLIESDQRKCLFLQEATRQMGVDVKILNQRLEKVDLKADIITARAFAPLPRLLEWGYDISHPGTSWILLKGQDVEVELTDAHKLWHIEATTESSAIGTTGYVAHLKEVYPWTSKA